MSESHHFSHRPGTVDDRDAVMSLFDAAIDWLVARGQPEQWGSEPWSTDPARVERLQAEIEAGDFWVAVDALNQVVGAIIVSETPMPYIEPEAERELYIRLLISDPAHRGANIGGRLLDLARSLARRRGIDLLRVDCFAGAGGNLVRYYEAQGFRCVHPFDVTGWPGMLLSQRILTAEAPKSF